MTYTDPGLLGAKRATWRKTNPRALLQEIIKQYPKGTEDRWRDLFWAEVEDEKDFLRAIVDYWLDNNIRSLVPPMPQGPSKNTAASTVKTTAKNAAKKKIKDRIQYETKIALLALLMPNNKPLAECTGAECSTFGGWFALLAIRVPRKRTVGETLSEAQVYKLWSRSQAKKR